MSDAARGLSAMTPPNTGMTNMDTGTAYSNASGGNFGQMEEQMAYAKQGMMQNMQTGASQAAAGARGEVIKAQTQMDDAQYKAQQGLTQKMESIIEATGSGAALMQLNALVQSPEREAFMESVASSRAMFNAQAPELGAYRASTMQYKPM